MAGITDRTTVKGVTPDITEATFVTELRVHNSPAVVDAARVYRYCVARGLSPAFLLGVFNEESTYATNPAAICVAPPLPTRSWGNTTAPSYGDIGLGLPLVRGRFTRYAGWYEGGISTVARLFEHPPYNGKATIRQIIETWAPPNDNNQTEDYIAGVVATMNRLGATPQTGTGGTTVALSKPTVNTKFPSPNRGYPTGVHRVDAVIWHITDGTNSLGWLTNPASGASSNYLIARDATIYELVPPTESAWANGRVCNPDADHNQPLVTKWGKEGVNWNRRVVSIEHEGKTSYGRGGSLTTAQIEATVKLTAWLCQAFSLTPDAQHIFGHFEIDACDRQNCPGFSTAEWSDWIGRVATLVRGGSPPVPQPNPGNQIIPFVHADGRPGVTILFEGQANQPPSVNVADLGVSLPSVTTGQMLDQSVQANVFGGWKVRT